jgi:hypothetical protein
MLLMRATVLLGSSAYHWRVVRWWMRPSRLFTDFRDGRVPMYGRPFLPWKRPTVYPRKSKDSSGSRAILVFLAFTSNPSRVINVAIRAIAAGAFARSAADDEVVGVVDDVGIESVPMAMVVPG